MKLFIGVTVTKVSAALASLIPIYLVYGDFLHRLTPIQRKVLTHPVSVGVVAYGAAYAGCSHSRAAITALIIASIFTTMIDDLLAPDGAADASRVPTTPSGEESNTAPSPRVKPREGGHTPQGPSPLSTYMASLAAKTKASASDLWTSRFD